MGLITTALARSVPIQRGPRTGAAMTDHGTVATASSIDSLRRAGPSNVAMYRNWAIHGELTRAALDIKIGQLADAEWELVPFEQSGKTPDKGLMNRMREILSQPNPGEESLGTFLQALGEDLWTLDAAPFEKERTLRGELLWVWPVDGATIKIDRYWNGDPRLPRYYYCPRADVAIPMLISELGYLKMHNRSYSPLGIPPFETLKATIDAELSGSSYNARQVQQAAPDGIMDLGENARPDQVESFKALWNSLIAGKSMMAFWGGTKSAKFIPFKAGNKEMQFIEWQEYLVRKLCAVMHLSPQDLGFSFDINKSTGEVQQSQTDDKGNFGLSRVQDVMTTQFCWDPSFGGRANNIAFRFRSVSVRVRKQTSDTHKNTLAGMPSQVVNEARKDMGLPPIGDPHDPSNPFNQLMANTSQGLVLLDKIPSAYELAMRSSTPPAGPDGGPPKEEPKQIEASVDPVDVITKMHEAHMTGLERVAEIATTRPEAPPVSVTIEKGAVAVDLQTHEAAQTITVHNPEAETLREAVDELRSAISASSKEPVVNVAVEPAVVDASPIAEAIKELRDLIVSQPTPEPRTVRRQVIRDDAGRIVEVIDHEEP